jgi:hypothetical protein
MSRAVLDGFVPALMVAAFEVWVWKNNIWGVRDKIEVWLRK